MQLLTNQQIYIFSQIYVKIFTKPLFTLFSRIHHRNDGGEGEHGQAYILIGYLDSLRMNRIKCEVVITDHYSMFCVNLCV